MHRRESILQLVVLSVSGAAQKRGEFVSHRIAHAARCRPSAAPAPARSDRAKTNPQLSTVQAKSLHTRLFFH